MYRKANFHFTLLLSATALFTIGCSKSSPKITVERERKNIISSETTANTRKIDFGLSNIQSVELFDFKARPIYRISKSFMESPASGNNNSQINTMYDGYGNKTEIRCFTANPVLKCVTVKTSVAGQKQAVVFGNRGEIKRLPDSLLGKAMTADASDIAASVGIFELPTTTPTMIGQTTNEEIEAYNNPVPTPTPTPEGLIDESTTQTNETVKPEPSPEIKPPEVKETPQPKIKIDTRWLNNYPLKKKTPQP